MNTVAVIGANGQLGSDIVKTLREKKWLVAPLLHRQIEVKDVQSVRRTLNRVKPEILINTAAFHNLNACEQHPNEAMAVNALGVKNLSGWCNDHQAILVHFSTDYVFGGDTNRRQSYAETDPMGPQSAYAVSKAAGEWLVRASLKKFFLIRTSGLYGIAGSSVKGGNFVDKRIGQAKRGETIYMVKDQVLSPTYTKNLAENLELLLKTHKFGLYHMVSQGQCSWYEFTKEILRLTDLKIKLVPVITDDHKAGVIRPRYSALKNAALKKIKLDKMNHWKKNLRLYLQQKGY